MRLSEVILLQESIVDDLRNSLVKGLKPNYGPGTETYNNLLKEFEKIASWAKNRLRKGEDENSAVDNSKVVWLLTWWILDTKLHFILTAQGLSGRVDSPEHSSLMQVVIPCGDLHLYEQRTDISDKWGLYVLL